MRSTEEVEEHGLGEIPETAGSGHGAAVIFPAYEGGVQTRSKNFLVFSGKPVEELTEEDVRRYVLHLMAGSLSKKTINAYQAAIRFFFGVTLNRAMNYLQMARLKEDKSLPEIFSREEVSLVLSACQNLKQSHDRAGIWLWFPLLDRLRCILGYDFNLCPCCKRGFLSRASPSSLKFVPVAL